MKASYKQLIRFIFATIFIFNGFNCFGFDVKRAERELDIMVNLMVEGQKLTKQEEKIEKYYEELKAEYAETKDLEVLLFCKYFEGALKKNKQNTDLHIKNCLFILKKGRGKNQKLLAFTNYALANLLIEDQLYENALEYTLEVQKHLKGIKNNKIKKITFNQIGLIYYYLGDFKKAKLNFLKAIEVEPDKDQFFNCTMLSNAAACETGLKNYSACKKTLQEACDLLSDPKTEVEKNYLAILKGNIGVMNARLGEMELAEENLWSEIIFFQNKKLFLPSLLESYDELLTIYLNQHNQAKLNEWKSYAEQYGKNQIDLAAINGYKKLMRRFYEARGDQTKVQQLSDDIIDLQQKISDSIEKNSNKISKVFFSSKIDFVNSEFESESAIIKSELKQKQIFNYSIVVFSIFLTLLFIYLLKQRNQKMKRTELINQQSIELENSKRIIVEKELKLKKEMVSNLSVFLNLKTETEKEFLKKIKEIKRKKNQDLESVFKELQHSVIDLMNLDKTNVDVFATIESENQQIIEKIGVLYPQLSQFECTLCSYFRIGLNSKEISSITKLSSGTIRVYKVKIKQKLNLSAEQSLNEYLQQV